MEDRTLPDPHPVEVLLTSGGGGANAILFGFAAAKVRTISETTKRLTKFTIMEKLTVGMRFRTNNTPRGCYHVITKTDSRFTGYDTVYPNGMRPFTSSPTQGVLRWLNRPHIGLEIIN